MASRGRDIIFTVVGVGLIVIVLVVLWRVLFPSDPVRIVIQADTAAESFSAASVMAMGERMGQSAEWTIATVLVIGSALIGLNWYQGDRRHQHDMDEMEKKIASLKSAMESRLGMIELATVGTLEYMSYESIDENLGDPNQFGYVPRAIKLYRTTATAPMRTAVASMLVGFAQSLREGDPTLSSMKGVPDLRRFVPELRAQFPELAEQLQQALDAIDEGRHG